MSYFTSKPRESLVFCFDELFSVQFLSSGLAQKGKEDEEFDGFLIKDIKKEITRAKRLVSKKK